MKIKKDKEGLFGGRLMAKVSGVIDLNYICVGRKRYDNHIGFTRRQYGYRTGFFGGNVDYGDIPNSMVKTFASPMYAEKIDVIMPDIPGSPGWIAFRELPLVKLSIIEKKLEELEMRFAAKMEALTAATSLDQIKNIWHDSLEMIQQLRRNVEVVQPEIGVIQPPTTQNKVNISGSDNKS